MSAINSSLHSASVVNSKHDNLAQKLGSRLIKILKLEMFECTRPHSCKYVTADVI